MEPAVTRDVFAPDENSATSRREAQMEHIRPQLSSATRRSEGAKLQRTRHVCESVACCKLSKNCKLTTSPL